MDYRRLIEEMVKSKGEVECRVGVDLATGAWDAWDGSAITATVPREYWSTASFGGFAPGAQPDPRAEQSLRASIIEHAREEGAQAERARILAKLEALKPMEEPYSRLQWAWEQVGEKRLYEKIMKAICGEKGGA